MEHLHEQVEQTARKINDLLDKPDDAAAGHLKHEVHGLEDDIRAKKNPISIEDRVKRIIHILEGEAKSNQIMNYEHIDMFRHQFEGLRETLRRMG